MKFFTVFCSISWRVSPSRSSLSRLWARKIKPTGIKNFYLTFT